MRERESQAGKRILIYRARPLHLPGASPAALPLHAKERGGCDPTTSLLFGRAMQGLNPSDISSRVQTATSPMFVPDYLGILLHLSSLRRRRSSECHTVSFTKPT